MKFSAQFQGLRASGYEKMAEGSMVVLGPDLRLLMPGVQTFAPIRLGTPAN